VILLHFVHVFLYLYAFCIIAILEDLSLWVLSAQFECRVQPSISCLAPKCRRKQFGDSSGVATIGLNLMRWFIP
jgi:hypothetical protein